MARLTCDGNLAAAYGALLARPDVVAMYPITPQTPVVEHLSEFRAQGLLGAEMVEVEGENSALAVVMGAAVAGGRVFTATSSWGLAYMYDGLTYCAGERVPVVMVDVARESPAIFSVSCGQSDVMSVRDAGWAQIQVETCQEILDSIIMAYRLAEGLLLPVMVCYDGFYLSHLAEEVDIPAQELVDRFMGPVPPRMRLVPGEPRNFGAYCLEEFYAEYRYKHAAALEKVKDELPVVEQEFAELFGRSYGGAVEAYRCEDAEVVLLTAGSCTGTARVVVDQAREKGLKVGLVKLRLFRPFPREKLAHLLRGRKAVGVIDRSVCLGWDCGHLYMELKAALYDAGERIPLVDFVSGIANGDITLAQIERAIDITCQASAGRSVPAVTWLQLEE